MADDPKTEIDSQIESYKKLCDQENALLEVKRKLIALHPEDLQAIRENDIAFEKASKAVALFEKSMDPAILQEFRLKKNAEELNATLALMSREIHGTVLETLGFGNAASGLTKSLLGAGAAGLLLGTATGRALLQPFSEAKEVITAISPEIEKYNEALRKWYQAQDLVNVGFLSLGRSMDSFKGEADLIIDAVQKTAASFFISSKEQENLIKVAQKIPGVMESIRTAIKDTDMTQMAQYMLVARAAGFNMAEAGQFLSRTYKEFGKRDMPDVSTELTRFAAAAAATEIPINIVIEQIERASTPFAIFGKQITETRNIWTTFAQSLKGLAPEEIGKLFQTVTGHIATMNLGTQAFVAQMSGMAQGASALGGALRMELEMREPGGVERNLERVQQTISKLGGGRIISLQEATQTPALEMQFETQRKLAGQMLGVEGGPQQTRALQVLQDIEKGGISSADASKNIQDLMSDGKKAQIASVTSMDQVAMGVGRTNTLLRELISIDKAAKEGFKDIGGALGAPGVGHLPKELDYANATQASLKGVNLAANALVPAFNRVGIMINTMLKGIAGGGIKERKTHSEWERSYTPMGGPIEAGQPAKEPLRITLFSSAIENTILPSFQRRFENPTHGTGEETDTTATKTRRLVTGETEVGRPETEPAMPKIITVKVVCEQCNHKLAEQSEEWRKQKKGDVY